MLARIYDTQLTGRRLAGSIAPLLAGSVELSDRLWPCPVYLDQGTEGACAGFAASNLAACNGVRGITNASARWTYRAAQANDKIEGTSYIGSDLTGGMEAGRLAGWWSHYRHCDTEAEIAETVAEVGPVMITSLWYSGMTDTDAAGFVQPTGEIVGAHAWIINELLGNNYGGRNSWGRSWGVDGGFIIRREDVRQLMLSGGEAAVAINERRAA